MASTLDQKYDQKYDLPVTNRSEGWRRLTNLVEELGDDNVLMMVMSRVAIGDSPEDVANANGLPWYVLRKWLEDKPERMDAWNLAKRCFADGLVYEGLKEVREASIETVGLAKLRSDAYGRMAAKMNRSEWGDADEVRTGGGGVTIIIGSVVPEGNLIEGESE